MLRHLNPPKNPTFSRIRFTVTLVLCTLVVLSTIATWWVERQLSGPVVRWAQSKATTVATTAINDAVRGVLAEKLDEIDILTVTPSGEGGIPIIRYNMGPLNQVMSETVEAVLAAFRAQAPQEYRVPLGELTGLRVLAGWGPMIPIRIFATGSVVAEPKVDFVAAGINQVAHRLYLDVKVTMIVLAPFLSDHVVVQQRVPVADEVLPGSVPGTYVNLTGYSGSLEGAALLMQSLGAGSNR